MKRRLICRLIVPLAMASMLAAALGGCTKKEEAAGTDDKPVVTIDPVTSDEPVVNVDDTSAGGAIAEPEKEAEKETEKEAEPTAGAESSTVRQDGERFESTIILEGMEETVQYEHIINETIGMEMDYDYEAFVRKKEGDREVFISVYDDINAPENYLEIVHSDQDAETAAAAIGEELSKDYEIGRSVYPLDNAGDCIRIDASADVGGLTMPDQLKMVYIIPAGDGSIIATAHYAIEASEGFGRRFAYLMHTMTVL